MKLAYFIVAIAGMGMVANAIASADATNTFRAVQKSKTLEAVTIAQSTTQTSEPQEKTSPSEADPAESKAAEKNESPAPTKKPFKKFRPSERIEAEQAVDFPYDI